MTPTDLDLPTIYYYQHKVKSDLPWIKSMLKFIPEDERPAICRKYERLFGTRSRDVKIKQKCRDNANSYLKSRAAEWRAKNGKL